MRKRLLLNLLRFISLSELEVQADPTSLGWRVVDHGRGQEAVLADGAVVDDRVT